MTEHTNTPALRFPEFKNDWIEKSFGDFTKTNQGLQIAISNRETQYKEGYYFYITNEFLKPNSKIKYYIKNPPNSVIANKDDILMTRTGNTGKVITGVHGAFHNNFFKIKFDNKQYDRLFIYELLKSSKINNKILSLAGTSTIPDLNHSDFYSIKSFIPKYEEQQKLGIFFNKLDRQIELEEEKLELLEQQKRGYMQKVFSQELRFKDKKDNYYSDWKNCQLKDLTYYKNGKGYEKVATTNGKYNIINLNSIGIKGQLKDSGKYTDFEDDTLLKNDLIMILSDVAKGNLIGMTAIIDEDNKYLLNQRIALLRIKNSLITNAYFLYLYINFNRKYFINMSAGMSQLNINKKTVEDFPVNLPNIEEQNKIAILFKNYEDTIKKQASKVKLLKQRKQGLLQKMFV